MLRAFVLPLFLLVASQAVVHAQDSESRREYATPGLIVETGARRGACDQLHFTKDGTHLLASGDDKVVRVWKWDATRGLEEAERTALRWPIWHESRGNIYAMALSPDAKNRYVAVGGQGMVTSAMAVIDRDDGSIKHATLGNSREQGTLWSMAFAPSGKLVACGDQHGGVWVWDLKSSPRRVYQHVRDKDNLKAINYVRLVHFLAEDRLFSVADDGTVFIGTVGEIPKVQESFRFDSDALSRVAYSPKSGLIAGASYAKQKRFFEIRSLTEPTKLIKLGTRPGEYPHSVAFSADGKQLAGGVRLIDQNADFYKDTTSYIQIHDLTQQVMPSTGPTVTYYPEAMAFHPEGRYLAVAGGDNHEVLVWDMNERKLVGKPLEGPGSSLWSVALSRDGQLLGFQEQRHQQPTTPNDRGKGPVKVFDLQQRQWKADDALKIAPAAKEVDGWTILTRLYPNTPGAEQIKRDKWDSGASWFVRSPRGQLWELPLEKRDALPRSYAFLPAKEGKPTRLAVGHLWGITVFELTEAKGPIPKRLITCHEGEVMGLAFSEDQTRGVSCSRDQTIAGFTIDDWPGQAELGANFFVRDNKLYCGAVYAGAPAWEAGLSERDEILAIKIGGKDVVYSGLEKHFAETGLPKPRLTDLMKIFGPDQGDVGKGLVALQECKPGVELYFAFQRPGEKKIIEQLTTVRQRPLWRFFPMRDREWVLWRWRDFYYDTSTKGDFYIGWQHSFHDFQKSPVYYRAEQFREKFHKPKLVADMLTTWQVKPQASAFATIEPPEATLTLHDKEVDKNDLTISFAVKPRGDSENQQLARVLLWINDYQYLEWKGADLQLDAKGVFRRDKVAVPLTKLRAGKNYLTLQAYNKGNLGAKTLDQKEEVRGEAGPHLVTYVRPTPVMDLYGLFVGVSDYRKTSPRQPDLRAADDARAMHELWTSQKGQLYGKVDLGQPLIDGAARRSVILKRLEDLANKVKPDDRVVFYLGGHGTRPEQLKKALKVPDAQLEGLGSFLFCCPDFDVKRLRETTLNFEEIYEALVKLPCRKIVFLDACHSGIDREAVVGNPSNPIRILTRDGIGPIILGACGPAETAFEHEIIDLGRTYGLFAAATRLSLQERFQAADVNKNARLETSELVASINAEVDRLVRRLQTARILRGDERQNPIAFVPSQENELPLATRVAD